MIVSSDIEKLREKVKGMEEDVLVREIDEYGADRNTKPVRTMLLRMAHYYHVLQIMGDTTVDKGKYEATWGIAREKIAKTADSSGKKKEIAIANLLEEHTKAWNMAQYFYEKATKTLCQMMITIMDYILQEKADTSVLYKDKDRGSYFSLLDEIISLNEEYEEAYYFLCSYDYCTERIAAFAKIKEYKKLYPEHKRLMANGMPDRVLAALEALKEVAGERQQEIIQDMYKAYIKEPVWDEKEASECYKKAVKDYGDETIAMTVFSSFVVKLDYYYEMEVKD